MRVPSILLIRQNPTRILAEHNTRPRRKTGIRKWWKSPAFKYDGRFFWFHISIPNPDWMRYYNER